jgi:SPP1 family predicted phage head-tail adaptor
MTGAIAAMRARVKLQSPTRVADELGGAAIAWSDEGEVWAEIIASSASEDAAFDASRSVSSHRVVINRRDGVRAGWRIAWGGRLLRVAGVIDDGAPRVTLVCQEEVL